MEGRSKSLHDIENLLTEYLIVGREWETFKCDCCDRPFNGTGWLIDPKTLEPLTIREAAGRDDNLHGYGSRVVDAVRVVGGEDWEYKPGSWAGYACPACTERIRREWIVMPDA